MMRFVGQIGLVYVHRQVRDWMARKENCIIDVNVRCDISQSGYKQTQREYKQTQRLQTDRVVTSRQSGYKQTVVTNRQSGYKQTERLQADTQRIQADTA